MVSALSSNFGLIGFTVLEVEQLSYFGILVWNCLFTPTFRGLWGMFPQMTSSIVVTPKRHFLARKHAVWAIKRKNHSNGSTWAQDREKRKGQDRTVKKVIKALYLTYLGRSPHWDDFQKNLRNSCRQRRNHVCKLLSWNFQGLRFYRGSNFPFSYWFFHGPYNSAALLRCLW